MIEPVSIISLIFVCVLAVERIATFTIARMKKSNCCGAKVEFKDSPNFDSASAHHPKLPRSRSYSI